MQTAVIRAENLRRVRAAFGDEETLVASQLARKTGLSVVTVNALLEELCQSGEVEVLPPQRRGGRPSAVYRYDRTARCAFILYAYNYGNGVRLHSLTVNEFGEELYAETQDLAAVSPQTFLALLDAQTAAFPRCRELLLGLPGYQGQYGTVASDFVQFLDGAFLRKLCAHYSLHIQFYNDINAIAYGHNQSDPHPLADEVCACFPNDYPPGVGIVVGRKIYTGSNGAAGEVESLPVQTPWDKLRLCGADEIAAQIETLLRPICCLLAPAAITLYGEYLTPEIVEKIRHRLGGVEGLRCMPRLLLSRKFYEDFRAGLVCMACQTLL